MKSSAQQNDQNLQLKMLIDQTARRLQHGADAQQGAFAPSQRRVLCMLALHGSMTQQRLLDELEISPASLSEVIGKLEAKELIARGKLEKDKRVTVVELTEKGNAAAVDILHINEGVASRIFSTLSENEKQELRAILEKLVTKSAFMNDFSEATE